MNYNLLANLEYCGEYISNISDILWYSHIPPAAALLILASFVLYKNSSHVVSRSLFIFAALFAGWIGLNLTIWFWFDESSVLMFAWSQIEIFSVLLFIYACFFCYNYVSGKTISFWFRFLLLTPVVPLILLSTSGFLTTYDAQECIAVESSLYTNLSLLIKLFYSLVLFGYLSFSFFSKREKRTQIAILSVGMLSFLYTFLFAGFIAENTGNFTYELYGLFPIVIFVAAISYLMVQFSAFNIKIVGANVIAVSLISIVGSQIFSFTTKTDLIIDVITTLLVVVFSYILVQALKRERLQKEENEKLAKRLEKANKRLKILDQMKSEFVSIASHQLRSPLTSIRGYASMLLEGSFGKLSDKSREAVEKIADSSRFMALSVEDYLNVSRIQSGNMKYELSDFNVKDMTFSLVDDMRREAMRHGLVLKAKSDLNSKGIVHADIGKTRQVIQNLVDNALKYTPKGTVTVTVRDTKRPKKIFIDVADSGIGMDPETIDSLFDKFERAHNANDVNVTGTGLGLYIARKMTEDMEGKLTATSEGEGKGSVFTIELPLQM